MADCDAYIDEAMRSIESLKKQMPDARVALVTHRELFRAGSLVTDWIELQQSREGPVVKSEAWHAPYDRVVFLDTDTLIIDDLTNVFPLLDKFDIVGTPEPNGRPERGVESGVPESLPELNNGFFAFRKTPEVRRFFDTWLAEWDAMRQQSGVVASQPAFRIALWKCDEIRYLTLGSEYNLLIHTNSGVSGPVKVIHDRSPDRLALAARVNRYTSPRAIIAGFGPVFGFITRRAWVRQYVRLTWHFLRVLLRPSLVGQKDHPVVWWRDGVD